MQIDQIIIQERERKDFGDIQGLADSIAVLGLLQPVGITKENILVYGERRIKAHELLGLTEIEVNYIEIDRIIDGEFAENEIRKDFNMSERVSIAEKIAEVYKDRKAGRPKNNEEIVQDFAQLKGKKTIEIVAEQSGFGNKETYRQAKKIVEAGDDEVLAKIDSGDLTINKAYQDITKNVHVSNNSGEHNWYTPKEFIESACAVMGGIDLDPATSELANETVQAKKIFTIDDNGLEQKWFGRVWLNPPYEQPLIKQFSDKVCLSVDNLDIDECIVLVNNATETTWFQNMARRCTSICFPDKRIKFHSPDGEKGAPLQGQAFLYFGKNASEFCDIFSLHGMVLNNGL